MKILIILDENIHGSSLSAMDVDVDNESEREHSSISNSASGSDLSETEGENNEHLGNTTATKKSMKKHCNYKHKFRNEWLNQFNWLKLLSRGEKICTLCNKVLEGGKFHLLRHAKNARHKKKALKVRKTRDLDSFINPSNSETRIENAVKAAEYKWVMGLIVEHNCPLLLMDHIPKLLNSSIEDSKIVKRINFCRTKATRMLHMLKDQIEAELVENLRSTKFSIIIDETTDVSTKKCLAVLIRYTNKKQLQVKDQLLSLVEVSQCNATALTTVLLELLEKHRIDKNNVIGFAADNASVMMGRFEGVQVKLKEGLNKDLFVIGCICHSLHLFASNAAKKIPSYVEEFVQVIYNYISRSPKRLTIYKEFQEFVNIKPHKILKLGQTRWLSLEAVVIRVLEQYPALKLFFIQEVFEDKDFLRTNQILENFNNVEIELYLHFLAYILGHINKMNKEFQSEDSKLYLLHSTHQSYNFI